MADEEEDGEMPPEDPPVEQNWTIVETATGAVLGQSITDGTHPKDRGFDWDGETMHAYMTDRQGDPASERFDIATASWVPDMVTLKARKWEGVKVTRDAVMFGGCATPLGPMDTDPMSQGKVTGAVTMAQIVGPDFSVDWTMADNQVATHGQGDMILAGMAVGAFVAACHAVGQALRQQIEAATTLEELEAVDAEAAPWPF